MIDCDPEKPSTFITYWIKIICMVGKLVNIFLMKNLSG